MFLRGDVKSELPQQSINKTIIQTPKTLIKCIITNIKVKIKIPKPAHEAPSSPQIVASIDDLLTEILLRLPIKSLIQFKLVSRHWHSLITSPEFCLSRNRSPNPAIGLFLQEPSGRNRFGAAEARTRRYRARPKFKYVSFSSKNLTKPPFVTPKFTTDPYGIKILQSCNGLMLCSNFRSHCAMRRFYIYNPTINRFSKLPKMDGSSTVIGISLAFDPAKSPHYKVVCVRSLKLLSDSGHYQYHQQILVYSSEAGPWRECRELFTSFHADFENGVYWNGAIHWISKRRGTDSLYFNPDHDWMVQIMPMPPIPDGWDWISNCYFGESGGHLHYIELPRIQFNVYELKRDYSEWFVKYVVDISPIVAAYPAMSRDDLDPEDPYYYAYSIFCMVRGGKEEEDFLVLQIPGRVIKYNLVDRSFESVHEFESGEDRGYLEFPFTNGFQHIESLCCV